VVGVSRRFCFFLSRVSLMMYQIVRSQFGDALHISSIQSISCYFRYALEKSKNLSNYSIVTIGAVLVSCSNKPSGRCVSRVFETYC